MSGREGDGGVGGVEEEGGGQRETGAVHLVNNFFIFFQSCLP